MLIAVTSKGTTPQSQTDPRFGRAQYFLLFNDETGAWETVDNAQNFQAIQGAGIQAATTIANNHCGVVITGHCGPKAFRTLTAAGVGVYLCEAGTVEEAVEKYRKGELKKIENADVEGHW